ncbi:MAG: hypothetical protein GF398_01015 [Chitinivibrionales bacterium]|nr:hypothetical protein [Chitinivibrionales bacterium]
MRRKTRVCRRRRSIWVPFHSAPYSQCIFEGFTLTGRNVPSGLSNPAMPLIATR